MSETEKTISMPDANALLVSVSPHIHDKTGITEIMLKVMIALTPGLVAGIYYFGWRALWVTLSCMGGCVLAEALWCLLVKKPVWRTLKDCSALVTGMLLGMNLSAGVPLWICLIGSFIAIWIAKQFFGGLGHNPFNPALVARVALLLAFPGIMTTWVPTRFMNEENFSYTFEFFSPEDLEKGLAKKSFDGITCSTPLSIVSTMEKIPGKGHLAADRTSRQDNVQMWTCFIYGDKPGCLGETSGIALILGGLLLLYWRLINWRIPIFYIGTVVVLTGIIRYFAPGYTPSPMFHVFTGGLLLGAIFMATDMVTSPMTSMGCVVFGIGCGVITSCIRIFGNYPEGVSFAILLMNSLVPLIDRFCAKRPFGYVKARRKEEKKSC